MLTNLYPFLFAVLYKTMTDEVNFMKRHQKWLFQWNFIHDIQVLLTKNMLETFIFYIYIQIITGGI